MEDVIPVAFTSESELARGFRTSSLDQLVLECIDEVLGDLLGRKAREAVYDHLERDHCLARDQIPKHLSKFLDQLEETFGRGSRTITRSIIRRVYDKLEWKFIDVQGYEFEDHLESLRARVARALSEQAKSNYRQQE